MKPPWGAQKLLSIQYKHARLFFHPFLMLMKGCALCLSWLATRSQCPQDVKKWVLHWEIILPSTPQTVKQQNRGKRKKRENINKESDNIRKLQRKITGKCQPKVPGKQ